MNTVIKLSRLLDKTLFELLSEVTDNYLGKEIRDIRFTDDILQFNISTEIKLNSTITDKVKINLSTKEISATNIKTCNGIKPLHLNKSTTFYTDCLIDQIKTIRKYLSKS